MSDYQNFGREIRQPWLLADWSRRYGWLHAITLIFVSASGLGGAFALLGVLYGIVQIVLQHQYNFALVLVATYLSGVAFGSILLWLLPLGIQSRMARRAYFKGKVWTEDARIKTWRVLAHFNPLFAPISLLVLAYIWFREGNKRALSWLAGHW